MKAEGRGVTFSVRIRIVVEVGQRRANTASRGSELSAATLGVLKEVAGAMPGVESVRVMQRSRRSGVTTRDEVFIVLATHDVDRDLRIVEAMGRLDSVDYHLVPIESAGMIPDAAQRT